MILLCMCMTSCHHSHQNQERVEHDCDIDNDSLQVYLNDNDDYDLAKLEVIIWYPEDINEQRRDSLLKIFNRFDVSTVCFTIHAGGYDEDCLGIRRYLSRYVPQSGESKVIQQAYIDDDGYKNGLWSVKESSGKTSLVYYKYWSELEIEL